MDAGLDLLVLELGQKLVRVLCVAPVARGDDPALRAKAPRDRCTDPARAAGHEHNLPVHPRPPHATGDVERIRCRIGASGGVGAHLVSSL